MRIILLLVAVALFWVSCQSDDETLQHDIVYGNDIKGLASPIKLDFHQTRVFLTDYFETAAEIDSIYFPQDITYSFDADSAILTVPSLPGSHALTWLTVIYKGISYDIPVFRSTKVEYVFTYESENASAKTVALKGTFNGWNETATRLERDGDSWSTPLILNPGLHEYLIVEDGKEFLDPNNAKKKSNGQGGFNSTFRVGAEIQAPNISTFGISHDSVIVHYPKNLDAPVIFSQNHLLDSTWYRRRSDRLSIQIPPGSTALTRSYLRVFGEEDGRLSNDLLIPLSGNKPVMQPSELNQNDKHKFAMYFVMVDRFVNANTEIDQPLMDPAVLPIANYYGGDLEGVTSKIEEGYLSELAINVVWLSPIAQNPIGAYGLWNKAGVKTKFSGYHGYWPISSSKVDTRFGTSQDLTDLVKFAHTRKLKVLLDYVANHVHQEHPVYQQHKDWATDLYLPDGSLNTERWDEHRLTTWFDTFLPTLDFSRKDVVEAMTDSALFWFENYDLDGFRHDATKHIPLDFWRVLTRKLKYRIELPKKKSLFQIGETYGNPELIDSYIGSGLLDAQFDFNLYDASVAAFATDKGSLSNLKRVLAQSLETYGTHHLMGNISGNQDRTRFISFADGSIAFGEDSKRAGYTRKIGIKDTIGYSRLAMLHAFNFTIPGVPVIYYGDEFGMPGANDPDNRRMMRFGESLSTREEEMLQTTRKISNMRQEKMSLLYGDFRWLDVNDESLAYLRNYFDQTAIVVFNTSSKKQKLVLRIPNQFNLDKAKSNFGSKIQLNNHIITIEMAPYSFEIICT